MPSDLFSPQTVFVTTEGISYFLGSLSSKELKNMSNRVNDIIIEYFISDHDEV